MIMNRRGFLKRAGAFAGAVALGGVSGGAESAKSTRPDIVIVISDDTTWRDFGCYGSPDARTPNIDRLAEEGTRFENCFTATAMCAPTRQQFYTGLFPVRNGAYPNHSRVHDGVRSMAHHLRDLGYRVGLAGKRHFAPRESFPFEDVNPKKTKQFINAGDGPYCLVYCSHNAHSPWTRGPVEQYDPAGLAVPPYHLDTPAMRDVRRRYLAEIGALDDEVGVLTGQVEDRGRAENTIFIFTSEQGAAFPFAKWTCYEAGLHTALIVRWPGRVKTGRATGAMVQYVDVVPTLIQAAGGDPTGADTGIGGAPDGGRGFDGRSFHDVLTGEADEHRDFVYGVHTTLGINNGGCYPIRSVRDGQYKLILNLNHEAKFTNIITANGGGRHPYWPQWRKLAETDDRAAELVRRYQHRPAVEFYDLKNDPHELHNIAARTEHAGRIARLRKRLRDWMAQQGDEGIATEKKARSRQGRGKNKSHGT